MERIHALIDKLHHQKQHNSNAAQLLFTVQLLHSELLNLQQRNGIFGTSRVAVTLPVNMNFAEETIRSTVAEPLIEKEAFELKEEVATDVSKVVEQPVYQHRLVDEPMYQQKEYQLNRPSVTEFAKEEDVISPYAPKPQQVLNPAFAPTVETPTLSQYQPKKELHEMIAEKRESLNDRLKQQKTEVVHALKETPIKDLRKGIGINDRFTFIKELFRGDEAFYERSIKTINHFQIFSEAEYWINRELKFKIGWNEDKDVVQQFYQLVRRRFS